MADQQTVALIDDDAAILDSLHLCLARRGFEVTCFQSAREFVAALEAGLTIDCVVTDVKMPGMNGLALQALLAAKHPALPLILITGHGDIDMAVAAIKAGAFDFFEKPINDRRLTACISEAIKHYKASRMEEQEVAVLRERYKSLSERQQQVILLAAEGSSNKEIALQLGISPRTVEHYRESAMDRMQAAHLAELVQMAVRLKVLPRGKAH
jgi:FixJ family two-component response regulator